MLVLRCPFKRLFNDAHLQYYPSFRLAELGVPFEQSIDANGDVFDTRHPWESIPSSYDSMAFKIFDHRYDQLDKFYIEIKASPAKIMQGHNVYGSVDFYDCCFALLELIYAAYPVLGQHLDNQAWELAQIDITYSSRAKDDREAKAFINSLLAVSYGQTKCRTGYDGTAYFGKKNSRLKKIKVYAKAPEVQETLKKNERKVDAELLNEFYTPELLAFSSGLIRWEVSLYHRYFERMGMSTRLSDIFRHNTLSPTHLQNYWHIATADLFKALEGQHMKIINDSQIKDQLRLKFSKTSKKTGKVSTAAADSAFRTYLSIRRDGWVITMGLMTSECGQKAAFYRHVNMLTECGLSRAALQNMNGLNDGAQIIPFVQFIQVDFGAQYPAGYVHPEPKHVYTPSPEEPKKPQLRLVA